MSLSVKTTKKSASVYSLALTGSLDSNTHGILERELTPIMNAKPHVIIFDLEGLKYISSMGLRVLFKTRKELEKHKGEIMMVNLQPQIKDVFAIVNALPDEPIFESMQELDDYLMTIQYKATHKDT